MKTVDTDGNGRISYNGQILSTSYFQTADRSGEEFRTFVQETERELLALFKSIDTDHNGHISREELQMAFGRAGLAVPKSKLDVFFSEVDANNDGSISFEEWRYVHSPTRLSQSQQHLRTELSLSLSLLLTFTSLTDVNAQRFSIVHARHRAQPSRGDELLPGDSSYQPRR